MAEDTRLKHSKEMLYIKNQSNNQSNQPQHPQQTIHTEKLLKETDDCNNIDYTIMDTSQQIVLEYLLSSEKGEILKRNGEELKKLKIGDKTYNFERGKPISKRSITKFNKIKQTMDYKKYELTFFFPAFPCVWYVLSMPGNPPTICGCWTGTICMRLSEQLGSQLPRTRRSRSIHSI